MRPRPGVSALAFSSELAFDYVPLVDMELGYSFIYERRQENRSD
jgi:hypothetical protein